jgi:hypothetical protein
MRGVFERGKAHQGDHFLELAQILNGFLYGVCHGSDFLPKFHFKDGVA